MNIETFTNGTHQLTYTDYELSLSRSATASMLETIQAWRNVFSKEPTFVQMHYGVPALMIRFDGIIAENGSFQPYELQGGCGWVGYAGIVNKNFRSIRDRFAKDKWPSFKLLLADTFEHDDVLWLERVQLKEALASEGPLQVRYPLRTLNLAHAYALLRRSIKPMRFHNTKDYGEKLGWWKKVAWEDTDDGTGLPWDAGFALKPLRGWGSSDVMLWNPARRDGRATRTQILETLKQRGTMYLQPFIPPMHIAVLGKKYHIIVRPFFGYDPENKRWEPWGGVWVGRPYPNLRIHGTSDAIVGPLVLEQ